MVAMETNDVSALVAAAKENRLALGVAIVALIVKLLKDDNAFPLSIPAKWKWAKPWLAIALGMIGAVLEHAKNGTPWRDALMMGVVVGGVPIVVHELSKAPVPQKPEGDA